MYIYLHQIKHSHSHWYCNFNQNENDHSRNKLYAGIPAYVYDISFLVLINENKGSYCKYANTSGERQRALGTPFCTMHICTRVSVCYILHMSHGKKIQSSSKLSLPSWFNLAKFFSCVPRLHFSRTYSIEYEYRSVHIYSAFFNKPNLGSWDQKNGPAWHASHRRRFCRRCGPSSRLRARLGQQDSLEFLS